MTQRKVKPIKMEIGKWLGTVFTIGIPIGNRLERRLKKHIKAWNRRASARKA